MDLIWIRKKKPKNRSRYTCWYIHSVTIHFEKYIHIKNHICIYNVYSMFTHFLLGKNKMNPEAHFFILSPLLSSNIKINLIMIGISSNIIILQVIMSILPSN